MRSRSFAAFALAAVFLLAGCLGSDDDAPANGDGAGAPTSGTGPSGGGGGGENVPPSVDFKVNVRNGQAPLAVNFSIKAHDPEGSAVRFELDANGDGEADFDGTGTDVQVEHVYTQAGQFIANLTATDGTHEVKRSLNITVTPEAGGDVPEPITFDGTIIAGVGACPLPCAHVGPDGVSTTYGTVGGPWNEHTFDLHTLVNNITASITQSATAVDLNWEIYTGSGVKAHHQQGIDVPTQDHPFADDLVVASPEYLDDFGTWTIRVYGGLAAAGDYQITVTFQ